MEYARFFTVTQEQFEMLVGSRAVATPFLLPVLFFIVAVELSGCGQKSAGSARAKEKPAEKLESSIKVPDGTPEELIAFITKLSKLKPNVTTQEEFESFRSDVELAVIEACNRILAQDADDASLGRAVRLKLNLSLANSIRKLPEKGKENPAAESTLAMIKQLAEDKRQVVAANAKQYLLAGRMINLSMMSDEDRRQLADDAIQLVVDTKASPPALQDVELLTELLIKEKSYTDAAQVGERLDQVVVGMGGMAQALASRLKGSVNRAQLPGSKIAIEGKKLDGTDFDWSAYRGKVVMVDFWATWCEPCVQTLPLVKAIYDQYHSQGFEIVAINSDFDRLTLQKFLDRNNLPWVQIFQEREPTPFSRLHPLAVKFGITGIPSAFLIDRDGVVVSADAFGPDLEKSIKALLAK